MPTCEVRNVKQTAHYANQLKLFCLENEMIIVHEHIRPAELELKDFGNKTSECETDNFGFISEK